MHFCGELPVNSLRKGTKPNVKGLCFFPSNIMLLVNYINKTNKQI